MSLYQTTIIFILNSLRDGIYTYDQIKQQLPPIYYELILSYMNSSPEENFYKSINDNMYQVADYWYDKITMKFSALINIMKKLSEFGDLNTMNYILSKTVII